jgi:hypothetical protein
VTDNRSAYLAHLGARSVDVAAFHHMMRADPRYAIEVAYCVEQGIPWSRWIADDPIHAAAWMPGDRDLVVVFTMWKRGLCGRCGLHALDWPDEHERDDWYQVVSRSCFGCRVIDREVSSMPDDARSHVHTWLERRDPDGWMAEAIDAENAADS